eukprot:TRINITY_DN19048_c0_g1_i1.p1 TRINITY_DN19048_c0_g1~~TRINITY_DN19048_c0_g1_i1.p1  ORF type:complete len:1092 (-),score=276.40 TRINITY_DN19048_c0_g1_i1:24-3299(-)
MDPEVHQSVIDSGSIRVAIVPAGRISTATFVKYRDIILEFPVINLSNITRIETGARDVFPNTDWIEGRLLFNFVGEDCPKSSFEDFQPFRKIHAVIGILHCRSCEDIRVAHGLFMADVGTRFPGIAVRRLFAVEPEDRQEDIPLPNFMMIPSHVDDEGLKHLRFYMHTLLADLGASLVHQFEHIVVKMESAEICPRVSADTVEPADHQSPKYIVARNQKLFGDYALLAGSPADAMEHYESAYQQLRNLHDTMWLAGTEEGLASALIISSSSAQHTEYDSVLDELLLSPSSFDRDEDHTSSESAVEINGESVEDRAAALLRHAIGLYSRKKSSIIAVEACFRLARVFVDTKQRKEVQEAINQAVSIANNVTPRPKATVLMGAGIICQEIGFVRKAGLYYRMAALEHMGMKEYGPAACLLRGAAKVLRVFDEGIGKTDVMKTILLDLVKCFELGMDFISSVNACFRLLGEYYHTMTPSEQLSLHRRIRDMCPRVSPIDQQQLFPIPLIKMVVPMMHSVNKRPISRASLARTEQTNVFIYSPFANAGNDRSTQTAEILWVSNEVTYMKIHFENPLSVKMHLEGLYIKTEDGRIVHLNHMNKKKTVRLPKLSKTEALVSLLLDESFVGELKIASIGVFFRDYAMPHGMEIPVSDGMIGHEEGGLAKVRVTPPLPLIHAALIGIHEKTETYQVYEGQELVLNIEIRNVGDTTIEALECPDMRSDTVDLRKQPGVLGEHLPFRHGHTFVLPVTLRGKRNSADQRGIEQEKPIDIRVQYSSTHDSEFVRFFIFPLRLTIIESVTVQRIFVLRSLSHAKKLLGVEVGNSAPFAYTIDDVSGNLDRHVLEGLCHRIYAIEMPTRPLELVLPEIQTKVTLGEAYADEIRRFEEWLTSNFSLRWSMDDSNSGMVQVPRSLLTLDLISSFSPPLIRIRFLKCASPSSGERLAVCEECEEDASVVPVDGECVDHADLNVMTPYEIQFVVENMSKCVTVRRIRLLLEVERELSPFVSTESDRDVMFGSQCEWFIENDLLPGEFITRKCIVTFLSSCSFSVGVHVDSFEESGRIAGSSEFNVHMGEADSIVSQRLVVKMLPLDSCR